MELYKEILTRILEQEEVVEFPHFRIKPEKIVETTCYRALEKIQAILRDDRLDDEECFLKIEEIVRVLEKLGGDVGGRHDFG